MRTLKKLTAAAALLMGTTFAAHAAPPGTTVTNTVSLSYETAGQTVDLDDVATTSFVVDRKVDLEVVGLNAGNEVLAERAQDVVVLSYRISNLGNGVQGFDIDVVDTGNLSLIYDANAAGNEGTWWVMTSESDQPGHSSETAYDIVGVNTYGDVIPEAHFYVHVYANIPVAVSDTQRRDFLVIATTLDEMTNDITVETRGQGLTGVNTVLADPDLDGRENDSQAMIITAPELSATKSVSVISENIDGNFNCATGAAVVGAEATIPGACVEYVITVTNAPSATSAGRDIAISDDLPTGVTYVGHDAGTFDTAAHAGGTVTASVAELAAGSTATLRVRATIGD